MYVFLKEAETRCRIEIELQWVPDRAVDTSRSAPVIQTSQSSAANPSCSSCTDSALLSEVLRKVSILFDSAVLLTDDESDLD